MIAAILIMLAQVEATTDAAETPLAQVMADTADARRELGRTLCDNATRKARAEDADRRFERFQQAFQMRFGHRWVAAGTEQDRGPCDMPAAFGRTFADYENSLNRVEAAFAAN